jgi:hypothetical protein
MLVRRPDFFRGCSRLRTEAEIKKHAESLRPRRVICPYVEQRKIAAKGWPDVIVGDFVDQGLHKADQSEIVGKRFGTSPSNDSTFIFR